MSKKNKKSTRRNLLAADIEKEKQEQEQRKKQQEKKAMKEASKGITKDKTKKKNKTFRIRKGVRIGGIVVKDAESKKKALKIVAAREALKMDVDEEGPAGGKKERKRIRVGGGVRLKQAAAVKPKGTVKAAKAASGQGAAGAAQMEVE